MSVGFPTKTSSRNSKGKRLGFGYEKKSSESPSVQTARAAFLNTILQLKPDTISHLFDAAYPPFEKLLKSKEDLLASRYALLESKIPTEAYVLRQPKFLRSRAIESLIPNFQSFQKLPDPEGLAQELELWGSTHNLRDPWCINHAITFLREFESADDKNLALALWGFERRQSFLNKRHEKCLDQGRKQVLQRVKSAVSSE